MTKKSILLLFFAFAISLFGFASRRSITLSKKGNVGTHLDQPLLADQPDVYYDDDNALIIIDGGGEVTYYDVEIESMTTWLTVISTQVNGTYDTIDVS